MAKLAVILFLFALCAVAMSARIAREEPTLKPFEPKSVLFPEFIIQLLEVLQNPDMQVQELVSATPKP